MYCVVSARGIHRAHARRRRPRNCGNSDGSTFAQHVVNTIGAAVRGLTRWWRDDHGTDLPTWLTRSNPVRIPVRSQFGSGAIRGRDEQWVDDLGLVSGYRASSAAQTTGAVAKLMGRFPI